MLRLPRLFQSLAMTACIVCGGCHTEIATTFSKPRNDDVWVLSLRGVKRRSNPQLLIANITAETKKKKFTIIYQIKELIFNFQFLSQPPCCFATSPLTKGGKSHKSLLTTLRHCEGQRPVAIHKPLFFIYSQKNKRNYYYLSN